jgi:hypothetical protein
MNDQTPKHSDAAPSSLEDDMLDIDILEDEILEADDGGHTDNVDLDDTLDDYEEFDDLDDFDDFDQFDEGSVSSTSSFASTNKSSLSGMSLEKKIIFGGIIIVVLYVAGTFVWSMIGGNSSKPDTLNAGMSSDMMPQDPVVDVQGAKNEPPMPAPIINDGFEPSEISSNTVDGFPDDMQQSAISPLTPLPSFDDQISDAAIRPTNALPTISDQSAGSLLPSIEDKAEKRAPVVIDSMLPVQNNNNDAALSVSQPSELMEIVNAPLEAAPQNSEALNPQLSSEVISRLENNEAQLQLLLTKFDSVLDEMQKNSSSMEARLEALEKEPSIKAEIATKASPSVKTQAIATPKPPVSAKPRKVSPKKPVKAASVRWVLKSAQPGHAVIANAATGDMLSVEIGSVITGLGRVTSVSNETGRWVVQGTSGRVTQ